MVACLAVILVLAWYLIISLVHDSSTRHAGMKVMGNTLLLLIFRGFSLYLKQITSRPFKLASSSLPIPNVPSSSLMLRNMCLLGSRLSISLCLFILNTKTSAVLGGPLYCRAISPVICACSTSPPLTLRFAVSVMYAEIVGEIASSTEGNGELIMGSSVDPIVGLADTEEEGVMVLGVG